MKRVIIIVMILLLLSPLALALERQVPLENSHPGDTAVYEFLGEILKLSGSVTQSVLDESNGSIEELEKMGMIINVTSKEIVFYSQRGVTTPLVKYFPPFVNLYRSLADIAYGQQLFTEYYNQSRAGDAHAYSMAMSGIQRGLYGVRSARESLREISSFRFLTPKGNITLDTSEISNEMNGVDRLFLQYEALLRRYQPPKEPLVLYASNLKPHVGSNVTVYGFARGMRTVTIHLINPEGSEDLTGVLVSHNSFNMTYTFTAIGEYQVFATGHLNGTSIKSNMVEINVTKIPTRILAQGGEAYIGEEYRINAILQDYTGRPLPNMTLYLIGKGIKKNLTTDSRGVISFNVTSSEEGNLEFNIAYIGSKVYSPSNTTVQVTFVKHPLRITLEGPQKVHQGENFTIKVNLKAIYPLPIEIVVDNKSVETIDSSGSFNVTLTLTKGHHSIVAQFKGDSFYSPSTSNVLLVEATPGVSYLQVFLVILIALGAVLAYYYLSRKEEQMDGMNEEEFLRLLKEHEIEGRRGVKEKKGKHLNDYYKNVYLKLVSIYNLKRSTTPRELLNHSISKKEPFIEPLTKATQYHEKYTYAKRKLTAEEIVDFMRSVANTILKIFVRDEL